MLDRTITPNFVAPKKFKLPHPDVTHLDNGARFIALNIADQPVIKLEFVFKAGSRYEAIPGLSFFTGKMLLEGTSSFKSSEIAEKLDGVGAFVEVESGFDYISMSIHVPTRHFESIESLLSEILFQPEFPESELEILKQIQLQQLKINEQKNNIVASRVFRSRLYEGSPYGHIITAQSISQIEVVDISAHYRKHIHGNFDVFLTGQFDKALFERIHRLANGKLISAVAGPAITITDQPTFNEYIEWEESIQSAIVMGKRSINKQHADFPALLLLNEVFGGYFGSRLMQNIREDKGYTYSIYSHLATMKEDAFFVIKSEVKKDKKERVIEEINREIEMLQKNLIIQKELEQVKNYLKGSILNSLTTPFSLTEKLKNIYLYDLDIDFYDQLFDKIDETDSDELMLLARNKLFNQPLSSVVVG